jgi:hypothetical protein
MFDIVLHIVLGRRVIASHRMTSRFGGLGWIRVDSCGLGWGGLGWLGWAGEERRGRGLRGRERTAYIDELALGAEERGVADEARPSKFAEWRLPVSSHFCSQTNPFNYRGGFDQHFEGSRRGVNEFCFSLGKVACSAHPQTY